MTLRLAALLPYRVVEGTLLFPVESLAPASPWASARPHLPPPCAGKDLDLAGLGDAWDKEN